MVFASERFPSPPFCPARVTKAGGLALSLTCCTVTAPHLGITEELTPDVGIAGELAPRTETRKSLPCLLVCWRLGGSEGEIPSILHSLVSLQDGTDGVLRAGELDLPLSCYSTQETRQFTSPWWQIKLILMSGVWKIGTTVHLLGVVWKMERDTPEPCSLASMTGRNTGFRDMKSREMFLPPHWLHQSGGP